MNPRQDWPLRFWLNLGGTDFTFSYDPDTDRYIESTQTLVHTQWIDRGTHFDLEVCHTTAETTLVLSNSVFVTDILR